MSKKNLKMSLLFFLVALAIPGLALLIRIEEPENRIAEPQHQAALFSGSQEEKQLSSEYIREREAEERSELGTVPDEPTFEQAVPAGSERQASESQLEPGARDWTGRIEEMLEHPYVPHQLVLRFAPEACGKKTSQLIDSLGARVLGTFARGRINAAQNGWRHLALPAGVSVREALLRLRSERELVTAAEPNFLYSLQATPNDPHFSSQWGVHNTGQTWGTADADIDAVEAWDRRNDASALVVAVCDSGVDYQHPDLAANMWRNGAEANGQAGVDDDGNGYVDDVHGYDFFDDDSNPMDEHSHGTHVSGTIGAVGNNNLGVVGVAWKVKLMALKIGNAQGSVSQAAASAAIYYAINKNVKLSNHSWSGPGCSQALADAVNAAKNAGHLIIAAAGNEAKDNDSSPSYPASMAQPNLLAVAATDHNDALANFSNYGATSVDLAAPGVDILSTVPGQQYGHMGGTSMAAPHVTGLCALVWAQRPALSLSEVRQAVLDSVDRLGSLSGKCVTGGRLNAYKALEQQNPDPDPSSSQQLVLGLGDSGYGWVETLDVSSSTASHLGWAHYAWQSYAFNNGELRTAVGDVDGDSRDELILAPRSGGSGWVQLRDDHEAGYAHMTWLRLRWGAYNNANGEIFPAAGDLDGDGRDELVLATGAGGKGWAQVLEDRNANFAHVRWLRVGWGSYASRETAELHPAAGDLDGDGRDEIVLGLGSGSAGWFQLLDDLSNNLRHLGWRRVAWQAYNSANGSSFPACADLTGDGRKELVLGLGQGGCGWIEVLEDLQEGAGHLDWEKVNWDSYDESVGATRPAAGDLDGDGRDEVVVGLADGGAGWVKAFRWSNGSLSAIAWLRTSWGAYNNGGEGETWPSVGALK